MEVLLIIVISVFILFITGALITIIRKSSVGSGGHPVHIKGGADIELGFIVDEKNYFKGLLDDRCDTVLIDMNNKNNSDAPLKVTLKNMNDMSITTLLIKDSAVIGRIDSDGSTYVIEDTSVSKKHCVLYLYSGSLFIRDLNSTNHTYVNDQRITKDTVLRDGDRLKVGRTEFIVSYGHNHG